MNLGQDAMTKPKYFKYFKRYILDFFQREIEYQLPPNEDDAKNYDELARLKGDPNISSGTWVTIKDPVIPLTDRSTSQMLEGLASIDHAFLNQYSHIWFSSLVIPEKTKVHVDDEYFKVASLSNYKHVFGLNMYMLKGRDDANGLSKPSVPESTTTDSGATTSNQVNFFD